MKFIHRLGYYLGGFSIGLVVLAFFLSGKNASCDYGPNARVIKNISIKPKQLSPNAERSMKLFAIDSAQLESIIKVGEVDFKMSNTDLVSCKSYVVHSYFNEQTLELNLQNCDSLVRINSIQKK